VSYLRAAPFRMRDTHHCTRQWWNGSRFDDAEIKYSTVQNWYPEDENGRRASLTSLLKRADCRGDCPR
jgi:Fe-S cluster assembly protein SufB